MSIPIIIWFGLAFVPLSFFTYLVFIESFDGEPARAATSRHGKSRKAHSSRRQ
jgi:hypothetical protein